MAAFNNPNLAILELVAQALGPVCESVIFVGGCATGMLLTQERPDRIRITEDVDIVAQALTAHDYHAIEKQVRAQGFSNDMRPNAPICRWVYENVTLDLPGGRIHSAVCQSRVRTSPVRPFAGRHFQPAARQTARKYIARTVNAFSMKYMEVTDLNPGGKGCDLLIV